MQFVVNFNRVVYSFQTLVNFRIGESATPESFLVICWWRGCWLKLFWIKLDLVDFNTPYTCLLVLAADIFCGSNAHRNMPLTVCQILLESLNWRKFIGMQSDSCLPASWLREIWESTPTHQKIKMLLNASLYKQDTVLLLAHESERAQAPLW
jgi:hypothetical protein